MNSQIKKTGFLLVNLGTPRSLDLPDIRAYLDEFLNDPYVIDLPWLIRKLLVNGIILNTRPPKTQEAYRRIWGPKGSPLLQISIEQREAVSKRTPVPVALGMRYAQPDIRSALTELKMMGCTHIVTLPLYPQYALSSTETANEKTRDEAHSLGLSVEFIDEFYSRASFIQNYAEVIRESLEGADALLLSYHGLPERHIRKASRNYQEQCYATSEALMRELNWPKEKLYTGFQSRLTRRWIRPFTDEILKDLPEKGIQRLVVACPSFVTDCLETLEEIGIRAREDFISYGGKELRLVPCLNTRPSWIKTLVELLQERT